jgi:hypothetical protein
MGFADFPSRHFCDLRFHHSSVWLCVLGVLARQLRFSGSMVAVCKDRRAGGLRALPAAVFPKPVRAGIFVESATTRFSKLRSSDIFRLCRPAGAGILFGSWFYKYAAPTALRGE